MSNSNPFEVLLEAFRADLKPETVQDVQHASATFERARGALPDGAVSPEEAEFLIGRMRDAACAWALLIAEAVARRNSARAATFAQAAAWGAIPPITNRPAAGDEGIARVQGASEDSLKAAQAEIIRHIDSRLRPRRGRSVLRFFGVLVTMLLAAAGGWILAEHLIGLERRIDALDAVAAELRQTVDGLKSALLELRGAVGAAEKPAPQE